MEINQYLPVFIDESKEHLQTMNDNLLNLENSPQDLSIVQNIFRSAHTLKGMSATMGFEDLAQLTHKMENVLDLVRNSNLEMNSYIFDCLFRSLDALESMVEDIAQGGTGKADVTDIVESLSSIVSGKYLPASETAAATETSAAEQSDVLDEYQLSILLHALESGSHAFHIRVSVRDDCVLKAARAYMVFDQLERQGEIVKANPSVEEIEQEKFDKSFTLFYISAMEREAVEKAVASVSEIESVTVKELDRAALQNRNDSGTGQSVKPDPEEKKSPQPAGTPGTSGPSKPAQASGGSVAARTIRVDIDRLDTLMNLFSELLIDRVRLEQLASEVDRSDLTETVEHLARVSGDLQNIVMKLRMVPIETVFNRFPRMIRDIAKQLDKKIHLVISGAETELDRTVIDEIGDPLVHLLRNAADHGLEPVSERLAAGKQESGTIHLRAFHSGNHVFIEIEDDGRGINREAVLKKAMKNGLVSSEQAERMSDQDVYQLLFQSGFSTAEKVSDLSGRGVGLDVVKTKINSLGGQVEVHSTPGKGTRFSVQLPLTLSIISALLIRLGQEKYAIPLSSIVETLSVPRTAIREVHGIPMLDYRNSVIPLIPLRKLLEVPDDGWAVSTEAEIVVVRKGDKTAALEVDGFIGQQEIVLKSLGKYLTRLFAVSGATILGDGHVALIIDTNALIR